jgi:hypothetical protein
MFLSNDQGKRQESAVKGCAGDRGALTARSAGDPLGLPVERTEVQQ